MNQPFFHCHNLSGGNRQAHVFGNARGQQFIGQHAQVLRIILEFDDVEMAVIGPHQVGLRSSAHTPDMLDSFNRHG